MVLKVVRGKILETLELAWGLERCSSAFTPRGLAGPSIWNLLEGETGDGLSETIIRYWSFVVALSLRECYILYVIGSEGAGSTGKVGRAADPVPIWEWV
jgi:hypothetical protein